MQLKATFFKNVLFFFAFSLILASCGSDEGEDTPPPSTDPVFKSTVAMQGMLETELGFGSEAFSSDFSRSFAIVGQEEDDEFPSDANGAFGFIDPEDNNALILLASHFEGTDTSNISINIYPRTGYVGAYDILLNENIFAGEEQILTTGQGQAAYFSSKLPGEFLFLYFIGGLTIDQGKGVLNITDYDSEAQTVSGDFSITFTLNTEDDNGDPLSEDALTMTSGSFSNIPIIEE